MTRLILASASPRRRELLAALVSEFEVLASGADEDFTGDPAEAALRLAQLKAEEVAQRYSGAIVIGADTIVHDGARPYGKPEDGPDAERMLRALRGRTHTVFTGVAVVNATGSCRTAVSRTAVTLNDLSDEQVEAYVASGRPMDKAGAYAIQDEDVPTVASCEGCYCGVMGLPLWQLSRLLHEAGLEPAEPSLALGRCSVCPER